MRQPNEEPGALREVAGLFAQGWLGTMLDGERIRLHNRLLFVFGELPMFKEYHDIVAAVDVTTGELLFIESSKLDGLSTSGHRWAEKI